MPKIAGAHRVNVVHAGGVFTFRKGVEWADFGWDGKLVRAKACGEHVLAWTALARLIAAKWAPRADLLSRQLYVRFKQAGRPLGTTVDDVSLRDGKVAPSVRAIMVRPDLMTGAFRPSTPGQKVPYAGVRLGLLLTGTYAGREPGSGEVRVAGHRVVGQVYWDEQSGCFLDVPRGQAE
jgi:hypothetical protein